MIRDDRTDVMFETEEYKFNAIIDDIKDCVARNQPVLVGTISIEKSELLSKALERAIALEIKDESLEEIEVEMEKLYS